MENLEAQANKLKNKNKKKSEDKKEDKKTEEELIPKKNDIELVEP
jgi:hypothetical protein